MENNNLALESSKTLLDIDSYIKVINYKMDPFMMDHFWKSLSHDCTVEVHGTIYESLGYDSTNISDRTATFIQLLKAHHIKYREVTYHDKDFHTFIQFVKEAGPMNNKALSKQKWLVLGSRDFKRVMCIHTDRGDQIREYYLALEDLRYHYTAYSRAYIECKNKILEARLY